MEEGGCFAVAFGIALVVFAIWIVIEIVKFLWAVCAWASINLLAFGDSLFSGLAWGTTPSSVWAVWGFLLFALGHLGVVEARRLNRPQVGPIVIGVVILTLVVSLLISVNSTKPSKPSETPVEEPGVSLRDGKPADDISPQRSYGRNGFDSVAFAETAAELDAVA